MKIAIIDDERPARAELRYELSQLAEETECVECESGAEALQFVAAEAPDLCFVDINLGDIKGTVLAQAIRNIRPDCYIIFVTAYSEYAIDAFELGVDDYIMKPFTQERFRKAYNKFLSKYRERKGDKNPVRKIGISVEGGTVFADIDQIVYIETYNRGCLVHTTAKTYEDNKTIGDYEKRLTDSRFMRIHKSFIINLEYLYEMMPWSARSVVVKMKGYEKSLLPVGREKVGELKHRLNAP